MFGGPPDDGFDMKNLKKERRSPVYFPRLASQAFISAISLS